MAVIEVKNIGKKYNITHERGSYLTLRDTLMNIIKTPISYLKTKAKKAAGFEKKEDYWALKGINISIERGEVLGIIGRNGAGKSTLLKILSQITPPTTGEVQIQGRVGSLLEVGTGFHPELTGRENIFLNGAILGMTKKTIAAKFNDIVEFSGVRKFLDTPVKYYSSGMYVRLAFSVAAHMEPDILIVDEVLAVGDAEFQKKCLGKMDEITKGKGRTILFVSHNMTAIEQLCNKVVILKEGQIEFIGDVHEGVSKYINSGMALQRQKDWAIEMAPGDSSVKLIKAFVHNRDNSVLDLINLSEDIGITIVYKVLENNSPFSKGVSLYNEEGLRIFNSRDSDIQEKPRDHNVGFYKSTMWIPKNLLSEGIYSITCTLFNEEHYRNIAHAAEALTFKVQDSRSSNHSHGKITGESQGVIRPILDWTTTKIDSENL